jgi:hypothetical protein
MATFRHLVTSALVVTALVATAPAGRAESRSTDPNRTMFVTFGMTVALPGVTLSPGTYVFELADPAFARTLVRVSSRDRRVVYLTAFTRMVSRPPSLESDTTVSFGEARSSKPLPVATWWPTGESSGRQFVYAR